MDPQYFRTYLTYTEAEDYLEGLSRRVRSGWEQARLIADVVARCAGNKDGIGLEFSWEGDRESIRHAPPTEEEYQDLLKAKERFEKNAQNHSRKQVKC